MTIDLDARAMAGFAFDDNDPSILPPSFGPTKYLNRWKASMMTSASYDATHSSATAYLEDGAGAGRSCIFSLRSQGDIWLQESFEPVGGVSAINSYDKIETGGGAATIFDITDSDPAINGKGLKLLTGGTAPSVAGVQRTLGTIGDDFSYQFQVKLQAGSSVADDAFHIWLQNNAGKNLATRLYRDNVQLLTTTSWVDMLAHYGDYAEYWVNAKKVNSTEHDVTLFAGSQKVHDPFRVQLPNNFTNNRLYLSQQCGVYGNREAWVAQVNVGPTQLNDDLNVTSPKIVVPTSPSVGHVYAILEDTSLDMLDGAGALRTDAFKAFISKDDTANYSEVTLEYVGDAGWGEIDNTKPLRLVKGTANFPAGSGTDLRMSVRTLGGVFVPLHAYQLLWDYP